ncbi:MAG: hypothetical protein HRU25_02020 [Psychrobium sp.]|nr:hypothetical protein [Psychrobium sp.]
MLEFSTLHYLKQAATRYNIELNGPEKLLFKQVKENELFLPKLSPGSYTLTIVATHPVSKVSH